MNTTIDIPPKNTGLSQKWRDKILATKIGGHFDVDTEMHRKSVMSHRHGAKLTSRKIVGLGYRIWRLA
jgi:hypothetical protein